MSSPYARTSSPSSRNSAGTHRGRSPRYLLVKKTAPCQHCCQREDVVTQRDGVNRGKYLGRDGAEKELAERSIPATLRQILNDT